MEEVKNIIELNYYNKLLNCKKQKELFMKIINAVGFDIVYENESGHIIIANEVEWE